MSEVLCFHQCDCDCHRQVTKKHASSSSGKELFEMPEIVHFMPCCEGQCLHPSCLKFIKTGMMKGHLVDCHQLEEATANQVIKNPFSASMILIEDLNRKLNHS